MKIIKILVAVLVTGVLAAAVFGCGAKADSSTAATQTSTVKKGDLSLTITAAGNLALSQTQDLAVDLFYTAGTKGTIGTVLVDEGDSVKAGQVLVTLDTDEWNDQLANLEKTLTTAQRNMTTKTTSVTDAERQLASLRRQVTTKENDVIKAQRQVDAKLLAVTQAEINVQSANNTLNDISVVKKAKDDVDYAQLNLDILKILASGGNVGGAYLTDIQAPGLADQIVKAHQYMLEKQQVYNDVIRGTGVTVSTDVALLITQKKYALDQANLAFQDARIAVIDAQTAVDSALLAVDDAKYAVTKQQQVLDNAKLDLADANTTLADTQSKLADAKAKSPEIKAPFDGFVTRVNVKGGDEVLNGTVAVTVADPTKFEADILVSEMDIMKVSLGGNATISLNAMTGLKLPAKITHVSPTATISSGVVNYQVKVEVDEQAASRLQQVGQTGASANITSGQSGASANITAGQISEALQRAVDSGRITREQADAMASQAQQGEGNFVFRSGSGAASSSQLPSTSVQNFQLKQGLTGTVELIVSQKTNVVLVPNNAITRSGGQSTVEVVTGNNTTEKRVVQVGLADWQNTEITSGLTEGEKIIVPKSTAPATSTATNEQRNLGPGPIIFGR